MANQTAITKVVSDSSKEESEKMRAVRLWNWWNRGQDMFCPMRTWPVYLQEIMLKKHKDCKDRYVLFTFLVGNGVVPSEASECIRVKDVKYQEILFDDYDQNAMKDFAELEKKSKNVDFWKKVQYFDMILNRPIFGELY